MTKTILILAAAATLGGCASDGAYSGFGGGWSTAYYDDAYGPFYDGYWAGDVFWYSPGRGRPYIRDEAHHFHHNPAPGAHGVRGRFHMNRGQGRPNGPNDRH